MPAGNSAGAESRRQLALGNTRAQSSAEVGLAPREVRQVDLPAGQHGIDQRRRVGASRRARLVGWSIRRYESMTRHVSRLTARIRAELRNGDLVERSVWGVFAIAVGGFQAVEVSQAPFSRWFVAAAFLVLAASQLPVAALVWVRLLATAVTATTGALLTMVLGFMVGRSEAAGSSQELGALMIALLIAAVGGGWTEIRLHRAQVRDATTAAHLARRRHDELLTAAEYRSARSWRNRAVRRLAAGRADIATAATGASRDGDQEKPQGRYPR